MSNRKCMFDVFTQFIKSPLDLHFKDHPLKNINENKTSKRVQLIKIQ